MVTPADMDTLVEIGETLLAQGDAAGSLSAFDSVLANLPASVPALLGSAAALMQLGAPKRAYSYVDLAINVAPDEAAVWRTATSVALAAGDGPMAKRAAARRLELTADGIDGLMDLGLASLFDLDYPLARDAFAEAARVAPENEIARSWHEKLASIGSEQGWLVEVGRAHCRRGRFAQGLALFDRALGLGESYDAHLYAGRALIALGEPEAAARELEHALSLAPGGAEAEADLALARDMVAALERPVAAPPTPRAPGVQPAPAPLPAPQPQPAPRPAFCTHCGTKVLPNAAFCVKCGANVS